MKENTDSRKLETELLFTLDVRVPDQAPRKLEVVDRVLAGIDPRNDLILIDPKVKTKHFLFRKRNNILSVHYLGADNQTFLNGLPLERGKLYLLEKGDILKVGKIEIIIRRETGISKPVSLANANLPLTESLSEEHEEFAEEVRHTEVENKTVGPEENERSAEIEDEENVVFTPMPKPSGKVDLKIETKKEPIFNFSTIRLVPYKFYGFVIDIAVTYALLGFVFPILGLLSPVQDLLFPFTRFFNETVLLHYPEFTQLKILSVIEFFFCFHFFMLVGSLILGTTPGAFLIGLHHKDNYKAYLTIRFKACIYALLNIFLLPFLVFDIPLYKGKNVKELITFSEREMTTSRLFTLFRRALAPLIIVASLISPFFLRPPFTAPMTIEKPFVAKFKDPHTNNIISSSSFLGFSLKAELSNQLLLLPYFEKNKWGLTLIDLNAKKSLLMREENRISIPLALFKLRYSNPLASLSIPNEQMANEALKNKTIESLTLSLDTLVKGLTEFGPMFANGFLFKNDFLKNFSVQDNFMLMSFQNKNPAILLSSSNGKAKNRSGSDEKVFLFGRKEIIEFTLSLPKQSKLRNQIVELLSGLRYDQGTSDKLKTPGILEVIEAYERKNYPVLLTYYINEAKKAQASNNPEWRSFLKKNVLQTKNTLSGLANKNIERSFDDVLNTL
jgi:pSer/pThr/pTyr-binding forkhead associated (FHA) protein